MNGNEQGSLIDLSLEKELLGIWRRALKKENLTVDDDFFESGGDSLLATQVLLEIEHLTGKSFSTSFIFETGTVRQVLKKFMSKEEFKSKVSFPTDSTNKKIIHYFHNQLFEGGDTIKTVCELFGNDYNFHLIDPHLPHREEMPNSIEKMAKERLSQIIEKQSDGPYVLLGTCTGALVGFEVARLLVSMNKEVKTMVMIDPSIFFIRKYFQFFFEIVNFFMRLMGIQENIRQKQLRSILAVLSVLDGQIKDFGPRVRHFFKKTWDQKRKSIRYNFEFSKGSVHWFKNEKILSYYYDAFLKYKPLPLKVPLLYVSLAYSGKAWRQITKDAVYINIYRGRHNSWKEDYSLDLVNKIREFIDR